MPQGQAPLLTHSSYMLHAIYHLPDPLLGTLAQRSASKYLDQSFEFLALCSGSLSQRQGDTINLPACETMSRPRQIITAPLITVQAINVIYLVSYYRRVLHLYKLGWVICLITYAKLRYTYNANYYLCAKYRKRALPWPHPY